MGKMLINPRSFLKSLLPFYIVTFLLFLLYITANLGMVIFGQWIFVVSSFFVLV